MLMNLSAYRSHRSINRPTAVAKRKPRLVVQKIQYTYCQTEIAETTSSILYCFSDIQRQIMACLEIYVRGHSRSFEMAPSNKWYTTSYQSAIISIALACTIFKIFDAEEYHYIRGQSPCYFMHDWDIAKIYRSGVMFLLPTVWVYLHSLLHNQIWKKLYSVRWCVTVVQVHQN